MKKLRKFGAAVVLGFVLALSAFAGETPTPPCASPDLGQVDTPPCAAAPGDIDTPAVTSSAVGDMGTPTVANSEISFREIAADLVLNFLPLF